LRELLILLLGWLLGILSPIIVDKIKQQRTNEAIKNAIINEMNDLEYRLMLFSFSIFAHVGSVKQEFLRWAVSVMANYTGPYENKKMYEIMKRISDLDDDELARHFPAKKRGLRISKMKIPFTESKVDSLSCFSIDFQKSIISILSQLTILNEAISCSMEDFARTFIPNITDENLNNILTNIYEDYDRMAGRARTIVDMISKMRNVHS
jgi:hypothetical protein